MEALMRQMLRESNKGFMEAYDAGETDEEGFGLFLKANFSQNPDLIKLLELANQELIGENEVGFEYVEFFINKIREILNADEW